MLHLKTTQIVNKALVIILILLTKTMLSFGQVNITGTVIGGDDNLALPGVNVIVKGTKIGTMTNMEGNFSLNINNPKSTLIFSFIGYETKEINLKGEQNISIILKPQCFIDTFDHQIINIFLQSGAINNPFGGEFNISFPAFFNSTTLKSGISFQTNFDKNEFLNYKIEFDHLILNCDFQMDVKLFYRKITFENNFNSNAYSFEGNFIFNHFGIIAGFSELSFNKIGSINTQKLSGPLIGFRTFIGKPLYATIYGKAAIYNDKIEYQSQIRSEFRRFSAFVKFYKLESFTEISIGLGINIRYKLRNKNAA